MLSENAVTDPTPLVSVIVPCRNEVASIETCVCSILAQKQPDGDFEVLIADGMSDDGTRDVLARLAHESHRLRLIDNEQRIVSTGLNAAIRAARGKVIIRMDAHTQYASDYIWQCLETLRNTKADNVGGPWLARGKRYVSRAIAATFHSPFVMGGARSHDPHFEGPVDSVYLGCWRREVFDRIGLFDEELVRNQDDELNLRLTRAGGKIWQSPHIRSWYEPRSSLRGLAKQYQQYGYWKVLVIRKHQQPASLRHLVPGGFVFALLVLPVLAMLWPVIAWCWLGMIALYSVLICTVAGVTAAQYGWSLYPLLPIVAAFYHVSYGCGFLRGLLDFVILKRSPRASYRELSRPSSPYHSQSTIISGE
jgi:glycosyltransferase involved in cell wall biosynthesis